ncbi:hypothetical protein ACJDU8_15825 [Clostridium sp. WILCCON 0269]|uniref:Rhodanase C-terminal domain-containing protein n=1 Tax=Candidatus Clostridium eludens TaxID=3381663 RepID=A0ABW8SP79_9CLOT
MLFANTKQCSNCICLNCSTFKHDKCGYICIRNCSEENRNPSEKCKTESRHNDIRIKLTPLQLKKRFTISSNLALEDMYDKKELSDIYKELSGKESKSSWTKKNIIREIKINMTKIK